MDRYKIIFKSPFKRSRIISFNDSKLYHDDYEVWIILNPGDVNSTTVFAGSIKEITIIKI